MPNTLAHLGTQAVLTRALIRRADFLWIATGCVIPDLPWIARRILVLAPGLDPYDLQLYATVQASLIFCLLLCGGLALLSRRPGTAFSLAAGDPPSPRGAGTIQVAELHRHLSWGRDLASYAGLAAVLVLGLRAWWYPSGSDAAGS